MMEYDHLDPTGSLMDRIQALIQPPHSEDCARKSRKTEKEARKPGRTVNHDNCDSCGEGGDLLCCDRCPCAFHLSCCDPPLEEDDIPDGEWLCNECRSRPMEVDEELEEIDGPEEKETEIKETVNCKPESPFSTLVKMSAGKNPTTFSLPPELKCNTLFPGDRKRGSSSDEKLPPAKNGKRNGDGDEHGFPARRLCFACSRTELAGQLVHCDFCPLVFHNDCLNPPLTTPPSGMWMCPNHAEHAEPGLRDPRFSKRCQAYHDLRNNISQHTIKLNFLKKVHRLQNHPGFKRKAHLPTRRRASLVPQAIKDHYECPPVTQLPEHIRKMQDPLPLHSLPQNLPSLEDQEEWLRCVVNLQCSIAKQFSQLPSNKMLISNFNPHLVEGNTGAKGDQVCTTTTSTSSSVSSTLTANSIGSARDIVANGIVASKSELTNHVPPSSNNGVGSTCINRVVTTITTTSGGKTVTKPLTILYASPSKLQSHMNGPTSSNCGKSGVSASAVNAVSVLSNSLPTKMSIKQESKLEKTGLSTGQQKTNGIPKLLNDSLHLNNMKVKTSSEGVKTVSGTSGNSTNALASGNTWIATAATATSSVTVPTSTASANKVTPTTPTKLLVLTNASSGNIIKTIATAGTNQLSGGTLLTLSAPGAVNSGAAKVLSGVTNSPTVTTSASSSPGRVAQGANTSAVTASAINSICAAAGVDAFNETELAKLDPRLIQVLAYQRLQQLLTQSKPVPPSPVAARKLTFNGLKEALVLPQQSVTAGCSIAVLCPLTGTGPLSPMVHKCLAIGKAEDKNKPFVITSGPDMDVSLHDHGHCNFVSEKHCCIFYDEMSKQYELINYSEHGTYVDNVLYSCDFSDKINRHITSAKGLDPSKVSKSKLLTAAENKNSVKSKVARRTVGFSVQNISQPCSCTTSSSNLIGGSGAGWEGTALLHHGSYIKVGCVQFVFSITNQATKLPAYPKVSSVNNTSSSSPSKSSIPS